MEANMSFELDPVRYGVLWNTVENNEKKLEEMNKKMDKMEGKIEELLAMAERSKGSLWALMGVASVVGGVISMLTDFIFIKK
jgi:VIT1/CCC1 family predicted Fe2+/Mn2+ transporter